MKKLIVILIFFCSCHNIAHNYTIVQRVELNRNKGEKYVVYMKFYFATQVLITDSLYYAGDTIDFIPRKR
jgi:hypothetical protein